MSKEQEALDYLKFKLKDKNLLVNYGFVIDSFEPRVKEKLEILEQALEDLELYKKALSIAIKTNECEEYIEQFDKYCIEKSDADDDVNCVECIKEYCLDQARKELSNERSLVHTKRA